MLKQSVLLKYVRLMKFYSVISGEEEDETCVGRQWEMLPGFRFVEVIVKVLGEPWIYDLCKSDYDLVIKDNTGIEIAEIRLPNTIYAKLDNLRSEFGYVSVIDLSNASRWIYRFTYK